MPVVETEPQSNLSKTLCMSLLFASLMKIQPEMNSLLARQHFPILFIGTRKGKYNIPHATSQIWSKIEVQDFILIFIISKLVEDLIKRKFATALIFSPSYVETLWLQCKTR